MRLGRKLRGDQLRLMLAVVVLLVAAKMAWDIANPPADLFSLTD